MSKIKKSEHYKETKFIIYKITDEDNKAFPVQYLTLTALRNYVINNIWEDLNQCHDADLQLSQEELAENNENIFAFLDMWNYKIERILVNDLK